MIDKNEIIKLANALALRPDTVEKDYVLGWLLWGINNDKELAKTWNFKGGTCLKKCFFETFRFSEDLDFTISSSKHFSVGFLVDKFRSICEEIYESSGIEFSQDQFNFEILPKERGKISAQGKIYYRGPLKRQSSFSSIKLDLTNDEIVVLKSKQREVYHPYSDKPEEEIVANCYPFEEVIAEKIRALAERARPRDLYDVIHFFRHKHIIENPGLILNVLQKKCSYKNIDIPTFLTIKKHEKIAELQSQWSNMLAHQLPVLPELKSFWEELPLFFDWLHGITNNSQIVEPLIEDGVVFQPDFSVNANSINTIIERIRFAAANRVCIEIKYHKKNRTVEPLSFRKSKAGKNFLVGYEINSSKIKRYNLLEIERVDITDRAYSERRYPVDIEVRGTVDIKSFQKRIY